MDCKNPLPSLLGITPEKEITAIPSGGLQRLMEVEKEVFEILMGHKVRYKFNDFSKVNEFYVSVYGLLNEGLLTNIQFDEHDLRDYVLTLSVREFEGDEQIRLGLYTGILLQLLTAQNREKGKRTQLYIDGKGLEFNYLFNFAKDVDEVIVDNFKGVRLCSNIGGFGGKAGLVAVLNSKGDYAASDVGAFNGFARYVVAVNNEGSYIGGAIASNSGRSELVAIINNQGNLIGWHAASQGRMDSVYLIGNKGNKLGSDLGSLHPSRVKLVVVDDCHGEGVCYNLGFSTGDEKSMGNVMISNCNAAEVYPTIGVDGNVTELLLHNLGRAEWIDDARSHVNLSSSGRWYKLAKIFKISEMQKLADSLKNATPGQVKSAMSQIQLIYKEIRPNLPRLPS